MKHLVQLLNPANTEPKLEQWAWAIAVTAMYAISAGVSFGAITWLLSL